jgi:hypothetical protein
MKSQCAKPDISPFSLFDVVDIKDIIDVGLL